MALGPDLAGNAIWDGIKYLLDHVRKRANNDVAPTTGIELRTRLVSGEVIGIIDTSDPDIASQALAAYSSAVDVAAEQAGVQGRHVVVWGSDGDGGWAPPH